MGAIRVGQCRAGRAGGGQRVPSAELGCRQPDWVGQAFSGIVDVAGGDGS